MKCFPVLIFLLFSSLSLQSLVAQEVQPALEDLFIQFQNLRDFTRSPSGEEAYFTLQSPRGERSVILKIMYSNGSWSRPEIASFSGRYHDLEAAFAPDGTRLFFVSDRPVHPSGNPGDYNIWSVRKTAADNWSDPQMLDEICTSTADEFFPSLTRSNHLYFTCNYPDSSGKDEIYRSQWTGTSYSSPERLSDAINTPGYEFNAWVAPDESYLIYSGYEREDGFGSGDLYISRRETNGRWSSGKNLGRAINSDQMDYCPFIHEASGTLYFTSRRSAVERTTHEFKNLEELLKYFRKYENGNSRIYQIALQTLFSSQ